MENIKGDIFGSKMFLERPDLFGNISHLFCKRSSYLTSVRSFNMEQVLIRGPHGQQAHCRVNQLSMYLELKLLFVIFPHFIIAFIIINDSVPNEGKVLCRWLYSSAFGKRFDEELDLQSNVEFRLNRPGKMPVGR